MGLTRTDGTSKVPRGSGQVEKRSSVKAFFGRIISLAPASQSKTTGKVQQEQGNMPSVQRTEKPISAKKEGCDAPSVEKTNRVRASLKIGSVRIELARGESLFERMVQKHGKTKTFEEGRVATPPQPATTTQVDSSREELPQAHVAILADPTGLVGYRPLDWAGTSSSQKILVFSALLVTMSDKHRKLEYTSNSVISVVDDTENKKLQSKEVLLAYLNTVEKTMRDSSDVQELRNLNGALTNLSLSECFREVADDGVKNKCAAIKRSLAEQIGNISPQAAPQTKPMNSVDTVLQQARELSAPTKEKAAIEQVYRKRLLSRIGNSSSQEPSPTIKILQSIHELATGSSTYEDIKKLQQACDLVQSSGMSRKESEAFRTTKRVVQECGVNIVKTQIDTVDLSSIAEVNKNISSLFKGIEDTVLKSKQGAFLEEVKLKEKPLVAAEVSKESFPSTLSERSSDELGVLYKTIPTLELAKEQEDQLLIAIRAEYIKRAITSNTPASIAGLTALAYRKTKNDKFTCEWKKVFDVMNSLVTESNFEKFFDTFVEINKNNFTDEDRNQLWVVLKNLMPATTAEINRNNFTDEDRKRLEVLSKIVILAATTGTNRNNITDKDRNQLDVLLKKATAAATAGINKNNFTDENRSELEVLLKNVIPAATAEIADIPQGSIEVSGLQNEALLKPNTREGHVESVASGLFAVSSAVYLGTDMSKICAGADAGSKLTLIAQLNTAIANTVMSSLFEGIPSQDLSEGEKNMYQTKIRLRSQFWADVVSSCIQKGDFCSAMAVYAALNNSAISRLLDPETKEKIGVLDTLLSPNSSYKNLRKAYSERAENKAICIPFFGTFLTDATFIAENNPPDGIINQLGKIVIQQREFQEIIVQKKGIQPAQLDLQTEGTILEDCYKTSLKIKPRE